LYSISLLGSFACSSKSARKSEERGGSYGAVDSRI
jgi:hypothetical protein